MDNVQNCDSYKTFQSDPSSSSKHWQHETRYTNSRQIKHFCATIRLELKLMLLVYKS
jgi:hypothetical protein